MEEEAEKIMSCKIGRISVKCFVLDVTHLLALGAAVVICTSQAHSSLKGRGAAEKPGFRENHLSLG